MDIRELRKKSGVGGVTKVSTFVPTAQVELLKSVGIKPEVVIVEAFAEASSAVEKDAALLQIVGNKTQVKEQMPKPPERGDYKPEKAVDRIYKYLDNPDVSATVRELAEKLNLNETYTYTLLAQLKKDVQHSTEIPKRYFLKKHGDPALKEMFPKGTTASAMR